MPSKIRSSASPISFARTHPKPTQPPRLDWKAYGAIQVKLANAKLSVSLQGKLEKAFDAMKKKAAADRFEHHLEPLTKWEADQLGKMMPALTPKERQALEKAAWMLRDRKIDPGFYQPISSQQVGQLAEAGERAQLGIAARHAVRLHGVTPTGE